MSDQMSEMFGYQTKIAELWIEPVWDPKHEQLLYIQTIMQYRTYSSYHERLLH